MKNGCNMANTAAAFLSDRAQWTPLPLRLIAGYGYMAHGRAKIAKRSEASQIFFKRRMCRVRN
jgi:putative oxidoreductase